MHKNACSLLWSHAAINMDGKIMPCCRYDRQNTTLSNINDGLRAGFESGLHETLRNRMRDGERITPGCDKCWNREDVIDKSMRTEFNKLYFKHAEAEDISLRYLEIGFSTHCNLACRMCDYSASSTWHRIRFPNQSVNVGFQLDISKFDADLSNLREIKIVGGEPMLAKKHDEFMELLGEKADLGKINITYHTNCTVKPSQRIVNLWKKMRRVIVVLSIDGVGRVNEIQRPGHDWSDLLSVFDYFKQLKDDNIIQLRTHTVVTPINVFHLDELYQFFYDNKQWIRKNHIDACKNIPNLTLSNMEESLKHKAIDCIENSSIISADAKELLLAEINLPAKELTSFEVIMADEKQKLVDNYFDQSISEIL